MTVYVVQKCLWVERDASLDYPLKAFTTHEAAERFRKTKEDKEQRRRSALPVSEKTPCAKEPLSTFVVCEMKMLTVYFVKLRDCFQIAFSGEVWHAALPERSRLFQNRPQAERYAHEKLPTHLCPFVLFSQTENGYGEADFIQSPDLDAGYIELSITELVRRASRAGLEIPEERCWGDQAIWQIWWEVATEKQTLPENLKLRRQLGLLPWHKDPFGEHCRLHDIGWRRSQANGSDIDLRDYQLSFSDSHHHVSLRTFFTALEALGFPRELWKEGNGYWGGSPQYWWEDASKQLNPSQLDLLWYLIFPYPYEITELELETEER